jgi:hypothetical protein
MCLLPLRSVECEIIKSLKSGFSFSSYAPSLFILLPERFELEALILGSGLQRNFRFLNSQALVMSTNYEAPHYAVVSGLLLLPPS